MRVVSWNLHGAIGASRAGHAAAWHYLFALDPDIALLQEVRPPEWLPAGWQLEYGSHYPDGRWGSAVLCRDRYPLRRADLADRAPWLRHYDGAVVTATADADAEPVMLVSIHASAREVEERVLEGMERDDITYGPSDRVWPLYLIFHDLFEMLPGTRFIAGGDLNAARLMDTKSWSVKGNTEFFDRVEEEGFFNCIQACHDGEVQTFFKKGKAEYQLDHLYCDPERGRKLVRCEVVEHPVVELGLSDHAPVLVEFDG